MCMFIDDRSRFRADLPGVDAPGSGLTRPLAGPGSARGRDSFGLPVAPVRHSL